MKLLIHMHFSQKMLQHKDHTFKSYILDKNAQNECLHFKTFHTSELKQYAPLIFQNKGIHIQKKSQVLNKEQTLKTNEQIYPKY